MAFQAAPLSVAAMISLQIRLRESRGRESSQKKFITEFTDGAEKRGPRMC